MNLGDQLISQLNRIDFGPIAQDMARSISEQSITNSDSGRAFGTDRYDNEYTPRYAVQAKGGSRSPVTLRAGRRRIESQKVTVVGNLAQISFTDSEGGQILHYHHKGINYRRVGLRQRSIFPQTPGSVPDDLRNKLIRSLWEALR